MKKSWLSSLFVAAAMMLGWSNPALAADGKLASTERLLPKTTYAYLSIPSVDKLKEHMDKGSTGEVLRDSAMQDFLNAVKEKIAEADEKIKEGLGVSVDELLSLPSGELTFAVFQPKGGKISVGLFVDFGDNKETVEKLLAKMREAAEQSNTDISTQEIEGTEVTSFKPQGAVEDFMPMIFTKDGRFVFTLGKKAATELLSRWGGENDQCLAKAERFEYTMEKCKGEGSSEPSMVFYAEPINLITAGIQAAGPQAAQANMAMAFLPIIGLDRLKAIGGVSEIHDSGEFESVTRMLTYVEQPASGALQAFECPKTNQTPPDWVSARAVSYFVANWDAQNAYNAIETLVDGFQGAGSVSSMLDNIAEQDPGIHLKKDVLDRMTGQFHMISEVPATDREAAELTVFALDLKDEAGFKDLLDKIAHIDGFPGESREFQGTTLIDFDLSGLPNAGQLFGEDDAKLSIGVANGHLMVGQTPIVEEMVRRKSADEPLAKSAEYQMVAKHFPSETSMLTYTSPNGNALREVWESLRKGEIPNAPQGGDMPAEVGEILKKLPPYEALAKYMTHSGGYTIPDEKGVLSVSFSLRKAR